MLSFLTAPTLTHYLVLGAMLFALSVIGIFLNRRNLIVLLMAIELMLLAVNMNFVAFSHYLGDMDGQVFVFFILTVAAAGCGGSSMVGGIFTRRMRPAFFARTCSAGSMYLESLRRRSVSAMAATMATSSSTAAICSAYRYLV